MPSKNVVKLTECLCQAAGDLAAIAVRARSPVSIPALEERRRLIKDMTATFEDDHVVAIWMLFKKAERGTWAAAWSGKKSKRQLLAMKAELETHLQEVMGELTIL